MIYNLTEYLVNELATINFTSNGFKKGSPHNVVAVNEAGGLPNSQHDRNDFSVQIMSRGDDNPTSRKQAWDVFNKIQKKFGLTLPMATVKGETYPAVKTWKIVANADPGYIGNDVNGLPLFSTNYTITIDD